jgi:arylsulfatase A-like enzyme
LPFLTAIIQLNNKNVYFVIPPSEGVRSNKWKYIRYFTQDPLYEELFDLEADPDETQNMCQNPAYAKDLDRLRLRCDQLLAEARGA